MASDPYTTELRGTIRSGRLRGRMLPAHGAWLGISATDGLGSVDLLLDLGRGVLIVLRDEDEDRWEGRQWLGAGDRSMFGGRMARLADRSTVDPSAPIQLRWSGPGGVGSVSLPHLSPRTPQGHVAFARDMCRYALSAKLDHPVAGLVLAQWNQKLGFEATVHFLDGDPRGARLVGFVDAGGVRNLQMLRYVLKPAEPLLMDVSTCRSLGTWDPAELLEDHVVAWVGAQEGVAARLRDQGVPTEALHQDLADGRAWLRGPSTSGPSEREAGPHADDQ